MAVPQNKDELLAAIEKRFQLLIKDLDSVPDALALEKSMEGHAKGTQMSVHNLIAYLVGWNELVLKWHAGRNAGEAVDFPETGYRWNQLGQLAGKFYHDYEDLPFAALKQRLLDTKNRIIALVSGYDNHQLYQQPWYEKWTMGRMIQFNTSSPYSNARCRLRQWKKARQLP